MGLVIDKLTGRSMILDIPVITGSSSIVGAINGLSVNSSNVQLGGSSLLENTTIDLNNFSLIFPSTSGSLKYVTDISPSFTKFSIVDRNYVTGLTNSLENRIVFYTGTTAPATYVLNGKFNTYTGLTDIRISNLESSTITGGTNGLTTKNKIIVLGGALTGSTIISNAGLILKGVGTSINKTLQLTNSGGTETFSVYDNGIVNIGNNLALTALVNIAPSTITRASLRLGSGITPSNPNDGDIWYDGNKFNVRNTVTSSLVGLIYTQTAYKTVSNTTAESSLLNLTYALPLYFFRTGKMIRIKLLGFHSAISNPNITIKIKLGSTVILTTGVVNSANSSVAYIEINGIISCYSTGTTGTVSAQGFYSERGAGINNFPMVNTAPITINTTTTQVLDVTVQWGTANVSNSITISDGYIEVLN